MVGPDSPDWSAAPVTTAQPAELVTVRVTEAGVNGVLVAAVAGRSIIVTALSLVAFGSGTASLTDQVGGSVGWGGSPPPNVVAYLAISPGHPTDLPLLAPAASELPIGQDLLYELVSADGAGSQDVALTATYYLR